MRVMLGSDEHDPYADPPHDSAEPADAGELAAPAPRPTHAILDGAIHEIASIEPAQGENVSHSHRVKFSCCSLAFDVHGEHQFAEHAATVADLAHKPDDRVEVATSKAAADAAGRAHDALLPEWERAVKAMEDAQAPLNAVRDKLGKLLEANAITRREADKRHLAAMMAAHDPIHDAQEMIDAISERIAPLREAHAKANAEHHRTRGAADKRWITSDIDVTTCGKAARRG